MPTYAYNCKQCGAESESYRTMDARFDAPMCARCGAAMQLDFGATVADQKVRCFHEYVEEHFGPTPVRVTSSAQRDALCEQTGLTYDRMTGPAKPRRTAWERCMQEYKERAVADINRGRKPRIKGFSKEEKAALTIINPGDKQ